MATTPDFEALRSIFHEPARLSIMSALCAAETRSLTFTDLKATCDLTDGNLSRHLAALEAAGAVEVRKDFAARKPRTTIRLSQDGITRFTEYLTALEDVLDQARRAQQTLEKSARARSKPGPVALRQKVEA